MAFSLKRADLQALAKAKLDDADLLLRSRRFSNAYYLAGYAVEIGLKACIARRISAETIPDKNLIIATYSHELRKLVGVAGLTGEIREREKGDPDFAAYWAICAEWSPDSRYAATDPYSAQLMVQAVAHQASGLLPWIATYW